VEDRHRQIEDDQVRLVDDRQLDRLLAIAGGANDLVGAVNLEGKAQHSDDVRVIISQQNPHAGGRRHGGRTLMPKEAKTTANSYSNLGSGRLLTPGSTFF